MKKNLLFTERRLIKTYASEGNLLMLAAIMAIIIVNIPALTESYNTFWTQPISLQIGPFNPLSHHGEPMSLLQFINDALMAIFFLHVGLEIKREVLVGELKSFRQALLPIVAACGGMITPILVFYALGRGSDFINGMAIPMATDIAFSLGVLSLLGKRVPTSLKVFLTTLAVVDDLGGILVIAIFYSTEIHLSMLAIAACLFGVLLVGSHQKIKSTFFYLGIGAIIWYLFLNAGIHPTIAGVLIAFCLPAKPSVDTRKYVRNIQEDIDKLREEDKKLENPQNILNSTQIDLLKQIESNSDKVISPLQNLEDNLRPIVNYFIIPLFAFSNAGIFFGDLAFSSIFEGVSLAILCGLVVGKFLGIFTFSWLCIKCKLAPMPKHTNWKIMASISMLGGIGFTVSLFIANLSFGANSPEMHTMLNNAKLGVVAGSIIAGVLGYIMLHTTLPKEEEIHQE